MKQQKRLEKFKKNFDSAKFYGSISHDAVTVLRWLLQILIPERFYCCNKQNLDQLMNHFLPLFNDLMVREGAIISSDDLQETLVELAEQLEEDAGFIYENDPAAGSKRDVKMFSAGFLAITIYRLAHVLYRKEAHFTAHAWSFYARSLTGIEIHPAAFIAVPFGIDHGNGIVIGETAEVEEKVLLYHGVTLGAKSVKKELQSRKRHPKIERDTVIYANATILGGDTVIGRHTVIAANAFVNETVPPFSVVYSHMQVKPFTKHASSLISDYVI